MLLVALVACKPRDVVIQVAIPGPDSVDAPVAKLGLVALPYDRDSLLATFEAKNPRPAALTQQLDSLFQAYRAPFTTYAVAAYRLQAAERRLARERARLDSLPRGAAAYDTAYRTFAALGDSLTALRAVRDDAQRRLARTNEALKPRMDSLRIQMVRWEDSTYAGYDTLTKKLAEGIGREQVSDSTDAEGRARFRLPPGDWWIYARSWDAWDPNSQWYWNVKVSGERVILDKTTGRRVPRY